MASTLQRSRGWLVLVCAAVAACAGKQESETAENATADSIAKALQQKYGDTANMFAARPAEHHYGPPTGRIRVANLIDLDGKPVGPIDLYEVPFPDSADVPIIKHLGYGEISSYVSPRAAGSEGDVRSNLYIFPADQKQVPRPSPFGSSVDHTGFRAVDQFTVALGPSSMPHSIAPNGIVEDGPRTVAARLDSMKAVPAGQSLLILADANGDATSLPQRFLMLDGACPHAANLHRPGIPWTQWDKDPSAIVGGTQLYPVAPGTHTLGVVSVPRGSAVHDCTGKTPGKTITLNTEAGHRYLVIAYGEPSDGFKVAAAAIE
jgi:hypothetical protein